MSIHLDAELKQRLIDLAERTSTPFYAYSRQLLTTRYEQLTKTLPPAIKLLYSAKANPHPKIVSHLRFLGAGIDVSSLKELTLAKQSMFSDDDISFVGPGKSSEEIGAAVKTGAMLVVESPEEARMVLNLRAESNPPPRVLLRVNPPSYLGVRGQKLSKSPSQFGMDLDELAQTIKMIKAADIGSLVGFHFHVQSGYLDADVVGRNYRDFLNLCADLKARHDLKIRIINFGGGFGFPDYSEQGELNLEILSSHLSEIVNSPEYQFLERPRLFLESGRYLSRNCGFYVTKVLYRKSSYGKTFLIVDGGFHQNMAATGYGNFPRRHFQIETLTGDPLRPERVTVAGKTCFQMDLLAEDLEIAACQPGDLLCVGNSGAYGLTFSPVNFLSHSHPSEIWME